MSHLHNINGNNQVHKVIYARHLDLCLILKLYFPSFFIYLLSTIHSKCCRSHLWVLIAKYDFAYAFLRVCSFVCTLKRTQRIVDKGSFA